MLWIFEGMDALMSKGRDRVELEARRLEGARLLQRGVKPPEVARRLKVSRTSVWRWEQALKANGRGALRKAPRTGRPPQLTGAGKKQLAEALEAGALAQGYATGLWTRACAGKLITKISGKRYPESGVWRLIKGLNFSCQRPGGRASKRDEAAIRQWKEKRWPALKKTVREKAGPSSSQTSPG
jgi:transposase